MSIRKISPRYFFMAAFVALSFMSVFYFLPVKRDMPSLRKPDSHTVLLKEPVGWSLSQDKRLLLS